MSGPQLECGIFFRLFAPSKIDKGNSVEVSKNLNCDNRGNRDYEGFSRLVKDLQCENLKKTLALVSRTREMVV